MTKLYRVEYAPPVPPSKAWHKKGQPVAVEVTEEQFIELGFDDSGICAVEWLESPTLFVELWRHEKDALEVFPKLLIETASGYFSGGM